MQIYCELCIEMKLMLIWSKSSCNLHNNNFMIDGEENEDTGNK